MQAEGIVRRVAYDVAAIKTQYNQYKKEIAVLFSENLPRAVANREEEIQFLFDNLALLLPYGNGMCLEKSNHWDDAQKKGAAIYAQIEKQIAQLDCLQNIWAYEVQRVLTDIRVCFYYLLREIDEMCDVKKG